MHLKVMSPRSCESTFFPSCCLLLLQRWHEKPRIINKPTKPEDAHVERRRLSYDITTFRFSLALFLLFS